jgi:phage/plasmid-like protein (TIGR03299 family)
MAHELHFKNGRASMAFTSGRTPWHGLGTDMPAGSSIDDWRRLAGMDFTILEAPARFEANGELRQFPRRKVLYRNDNAAPLGLVSDGYRVVQPGEVMDFFRDLTAEAGFTMETAGVLYDGQKYWALARVAKDAFVRDPRDRIKPYLLLTTSCDGTMATQARLTTVAVVCQNTLTMATVGKPEVKVTHRATFDADDVKAQLGISADQAQAAFDETMDTFRKLASAPLGGFDMVDLTLRAFGHDPDKMERKQLEEAAGSRNVALVGTAAMTGRGLLGAEIPGRGANTAWGWLNAVTQYADHAAKAKSQSHRLDSAWFGEGDKVKRRALQLAVEYVGAQDGRNFTEAEEAGGGVSLLDEVLAATIADAA